jgi:integrase/recombinase XerD
VFDRLGNRKYLNNAQRAVFYAAIITEADPARQALCLTLFYTGCRISEALNLTAGRIDLSQRSIVFETLKRRKRGVYRAVPVPDSLIRALSKLIGKSKPSKRIWRMSRSTAYRVVKECMARAGIRGVMACPKGLRHSFAVECVAKLILLTLIQKWMGHAKLETTAIYLAVSGKEERNLARRLWRHG